MSMLQAQADELRAVAVSVGLEMPQAATLMMEAADTIWELRGSVHRERAEADRLRELMGELYSEYRYLRVRFHRTYVQHEERMRAIEQRMRELGVEVDR